MPKSDHASAFRLRLTDDHFSGAQKVLANTGRLRAMVKALSGGHSTRHVSGRSHIYSECRTSVYFVGFEVYRDAHFFYEAGPDGVFRTGVFVGPGDDVARVENPGPFDSDLLLKQMKKAGWEVNDLPKPHGGCWRTVPDLSLLAPLEEWSHLSEFRIQYELPKDQFLALPEYARGAVVGTVQGILVPLILQLRETQAGLEE